MGGAGLKTSGTDTGTPWFSAKPKRVIYENRFCQQKVFCSSIQNMSYQSPVGGVPDPFGYQVEGAQGQQQGGGPPPEEPPDNKGLLGHLLQAIQKAIDFLVDRFGGQPPRSTSKQDTLHALKTSLDLLKVEDRSQD